MSVESLKKYAYSVLDLNSPKCLEKSNINKHLEVDSKKSSCSWASNKQTVCIDIYEYNYKDSLILI